MILTYFRKFVETWQNGLFPSKAELYESGLRRVNKHPHSHKYIKVIESVLVSTKRGKEREKKCLFVCLFLSQIVL